MPKRKKPSPAPAKSAAPISAPAGRVNIQHLQPQPEKIAHDAWIVFAIALIMRVIYVFYAQANDPYFGWSAKGFDQNVFQTWAINILDGDPLLRTAGLFYYNPLFAYVCAVVYKLFGRQNFLALHLFQALSGAIACGLFTVAARTWLARPFALFAVACYGLAAPMLFYEQPLLAEGLVVHCYVLWFWGLRTGALALRAQSGDESAARFGFRLPFLRIAAAGLATGLALLGRGNALAIQIVSLAWCLWALARIPLKSLPWSLRLKRLNWPAAGIFLLGMMLILGPLIARNYVVAHKITLGMANGRMMFYLGNAGDASGMMSYSPRFEEALKQSSKDPDIYRKFFLEDLRANPGAIIFNQLRKTYYFFGVNDYPDNVNFQLAQRFLWPVGWSPVQWEWLAPLGLVGIFLTLFTSLRRERDWSLLWLYAPVFAASIIMILPTGRYRLPIVIAWALGAGVAVEWFFAQWRSGRRERPLLAAAAFVVLLLALWPWPLPHSPQGRYIRPNDFMNALSASISSNNPASAERIIAAANDFMPEMSGVWASYRLDFAEKSGDIIALRNAVNEMSPAIAQGQMTPQAAYKLLKAYMKLGQLNEARALVAQLRQAFPDDASLTQLDAKLNPPL